MPTTKKLFSEKNIHFVFDISLLVKGVLAVLEILGGIFAYFVSQQFLINIANIITQGELLQDPHDFIANYLLHTAQGFSIGVQHFTAIYLLAHGVVKLWLIIGLLREKLWYYPIAMAVFTGFIAYQVYRYVYTHSLLLMLITIMDLVVIALTWHEYRYLRHAVETRENTKHV